VLAHKQDVADDDRHHGRGSSRMWKLYIWPKLSRLKKAPIPDAFMASLACVEIHWASKFCCETYPVSAHGIATRNVIAPVIQTALRPPRQAAMKYLPQRWTTITKKNSSTAHRWMLLKKCPMPVKCHHSGPFSARIVPERMITASELSDSTPNT